MSSLRIHQENENAPHFITLTIIEWLNIFTQKEYFNCVIECLKFSQKNLGLLLYEYVIMTNHIHLIVQAREGYQLSKIIQSFKQFTTKEILKLLETDRRKYILRILNNSFSKRSVNQIWQETNYPELIESEKFLQQKIDYIYNNPVIKGYVDEPQHYLYSSARNRYLDDNSIIELDNLVYE
ncbi:MAG: transposase [Patescibacteria group bacterium]|nr:transposase [Patescibacteria group bacterium]